MRVCLFDLTGKQVATLFSGRLSSPHMRLPLDRAGLKTGGYLVRVSSDDKILLGNNVLFYKTPI
jgi:hypothetical protein